jgi:hypothetical protein
LQKYLEEAEKYLNSFRGAHSFSSSFGDQHINGEHHGQLNVLARCALEFAGEKAA